MSNTTEIQLQEDFDPALIPALYQNFRDPIQAILELTDNAIDDIKEGRKMTITVELDKDKRLRIVNRGGTGMGIEELRKFFIWGLSNKRRRLGRYGQGGKAAMGYLGKSWKIITTKEGENNRYIINEDNWDDRSSGLKKYEPKVEASTDINTPVVQIEIGGLKRRINKLELKRALVKTYRPLIEQQKIEIFSSGTISIEPYKLDLQKDFFGFDLKSRQKICGWISVLERGDKTRGGIRCFIFGRLISEREYFGQRDSNFKESLDRIIGELYIDTEDLPLTLNKTDIDKGSPIWEEIEVYMFNKLKPYIELLLQEKDKYIPTEKEITITKKAGEMWTDFIKNYNKQFEINGGSSLNLPYAEGQKRPKQTVIEKHQENITDNKDILDREKRRNNPATAPPIGAMGNRKRTMGIILPELKQLPETVRYSVIVDEKSNKKLFVNTLFPLFITRKKQLALYIWETLALEYSKSENFEDQRANSYVDELNTILWNLGKYLSNKNIKIEN